MLSQHKGIINLDLKSYLISLLLAKTAKRGCTWNDLGRSSFLIARFLRNTSYDLDFVRLNVILVIKSKVDIVEHERPNFVAEAVGIEMPLQESFSQHEPQYEVSSLLP